MISFFGKKSVRGLGSGIGRDDDDLKVSSFSVRTVHIDMFRVRSWKEMSQSVSLFWVKVSHDVDGWSIDDRVRGDHLEIFGFSVGEEVDRHASDRQMETIAVSASVDQVVFF